MFLPSSLPSPCARKVIFLSYLFCTQHQHIQVQGAGSHLSVDIGSLFLSDFICTASICTALIGLSPLSWISLMRTHHLVVHLRSRSLTSIGRRRRRRRRRKRCHFRVRLTVDVIFRRCGQKKVCYLCYFSPIWSRRFCRWSLALKCPH